MNIQWKMTTFMFQAKRGKIDLNSLGNFNGKTDGDQFEMKFFLFFKKKIEHV